MLNHAMSHYDPQGPTTSQNIHTMTHYDPQLNKLFFNDPK